MLPGWRGGLPRWTLILCLLPAHIAPACGPEFPNWLLAGGDGPLLVAPVAHFRRELDRLHPVATPSSKGAPATDPDHGTAAAEAYDLAGALRAQGKGGDEISGILKRLAEYRRSFTNDPSQRATLPGGLPPEFQDYLQGAEAWSMGDPQGAREAWSRLLARPAEERRCKSTWAAYMLARTSETNEWEEVAARFQEVRKLAKEGFADTLGLATASLGWEARLHLERGKFVEAVHLYLEQYAREPEGSAENSLAEASRRALARGRPEELEPLARDPDGRRVIGAWIVSRQPYRFDRLDETHERTSSVGRWLEAVEAAGAKDLPIAEQLALAAYQAGQMQAAARWVARAPGSPAVQWINAKLWLRAGKPERAAALLKIILPMFPPAPLDPQSHPALPFEAGLGIEETSWHEISARDQVLGELGALRLARREYAEALDALLRSGFWMDAAYVAERVLTLEELRRYVDLQWPPQTERLNEQASVLTELRSVAEVTEEGKRTGIRHLLGRRLARAGRRAEALPYLPVSLRPRLQDLMACLEQASDNRLPGVARARAWWGAALSTRTNGLELLGTEVAPDWAIHSGAFWDGVDLPDRRKTNSVTHASPDELTRAEANEPTPNRRFHYRHVAAGLAWRAAGLLPDNTDEKARILCTAGSWLKVRDGDAADVFYKALVRHCRKTAIGRQADEMRWFPVLDESGNPRPWKRPAATPESKPEPASDAVPEPPAGEPTSAPEPVDPAPQ